MRIGDVASQAGVSVRSLRYYEQQGLIRAERSSSGQRHFAESVIGRVRLIQQFFAAGLPSRTIAQLLPYVDSGVTTPDTLDILIAERARIAGTIADLSRALGQLDTVIEHAGHSADDPAVSACAYSHDRVA
ncbi:MerR family transcriptional regulator [Herbidospora mongoliensis]|uniref:MerR family transcriptional regulator n=1 Tax=Herbidospora mongoliensis TaxID=688067 RepID=UPI0008346288|nr:MerR family transcriptional regulator [Herbidospora mongoliensis]